MTPDQLLKAWLGKRLAKSLAMDRDNYDDLVKLYNSL